MGDIFLSVKKSLDIVTVAKDLGINVNRHNKALSPFTNEKTPSFQLYPYTQSFYCYSTNQGGTVIDLIMKLCGLSSLDAVKYLIDKYKLDIDISSSASDADYENINELIQLNESINTYSKSMLNNLSMCLRTYREWQRKYAPLYDYEQPSELFIIAINSIDRVEFLFNELSNSKGKDVINFYTTYNKEVTKLVEQCRERIYRTDAKRKGA